MHEKIKFAIAYGLKRNGFSELKTNQGEILEAFLKGNDVLFCSPTGSGKSLTFEIAPFAYQYLSNQSRGCTYIVVSPLTALMKTQVETLTSRGIKAIYLQGSAAEENTDTKPEDLVRAIKSGDCELLFASPESLLQSHRELILDIAKKGILKTIFVDEAHCVKKL